jgi:hypothetical protein
MYHLECTSIKTVTETEPEHEALHLFAEVH